MAAQQSCLQQVNLPSLKNFIFNRFQGNGGFAATPMLVHTITDTYCGVEILCRIQKYLGEDVYHRVITHGPTQEYLAGFAACRNAVSARIKYQLSILLQRFSLQADDLPPVGLAARSFRSFEELYYLTVLDEKDTIVSPDPQQLNFFTLPLKTVRECFFYIRWLQHAFPQVEAEQLKRQRLGNWLASSQNRDGGFGFYPGTTSYLENSCFGLGSLNLIEARPADSVRASAFVLSCQTGAGGFARSPSAAPFLEDSFYAICALSALEEREISHKCSPKAKR